jgi:hypothetical protein
LYFLVSGSWKKGGIALGLAVGTKWIALGSLGIYALVFNPLILIPALLVASPWFFVAFHFTGNPIFPIFGPIIHNSLLPPQQIISNILLSPYVITKPYDDFVSPLVGLILIFSIISFFLCPRVRKIALVGIMGTFFSLTLDPPSSRFFLPYLPALIISAVYSLSSAFDKYKFVVILLVSLSALIVIGARIIAVSKYIPYLSGREDTTTFLTRYAGRLPGTFIDTDNYIRDTIPANSKILIDRLHNLYYFNRDFDHTSWVKSWQGYDYLVTIGQDSEQLDGELLHTNQIGIQVFKLKK